MYPMYAHTETCTCMNMYVNMDFASVYVHVRYEEEENIKKFYEK